MVQRPEGTDGEGSELKVTVLRELPGVVFDRGELYACIRLAVQVTDTQLRDLAILEMEQLRECLPITVDGVPFEASINVKANASPDTVLAIELVYEVGENPDKKLYHLFYKRLTDESPWKLQLATMTTGWTGEEDVERCAFQPLIALALQSGK